MNDTQPHGYRQPSAVPRAKQVLAPGVLSRIPAGVIPFSALIAFTQQHGIGIAGPGKAALMSAIALPGPARARRCTDRGPTAPVLMTLLSSTLLAAAAPTTTLDAWQIPVTWAGAGGALFPGKTNERQRSVLRRLEHDTGVVVQGPPGTGKTHMSGGARRGDRRST